MPGAQRGSSEEAAEGRGEAAVPARGGSGANMEGEPAPGTHPGVA